MHIIPYLFYRWKQKFKVNDLVFQDNVGKQVHSAQWFRGDFPLYHLFWAPSSES